MPPSSCLVIFSLLCSLCSTAQGQNAPAPISPRWFAEVAVGGNKVVNDNSYFAISGWDAAFTVGARTFRTPTAAVIGSATLHANNNQYNRDRIPVYVCPDATASLCQGAIPVFPLADVMVGLERTMRFASVRGLVGPTVHRTVEPQTDYTWGTQFRADVVVPTHRRFAGVLSFRHSFMTERFGKRVSIRGISGGVRVQ